MPDLYFVRNNGERCFISKQTLDNLGLTNGQEVGNGLAHLIIRVRDTERVMLDAIDKAKCGPGPGREADDTAPYTPIFILPAPRR